MIYSVDDLCRTSRRMPQHYGRVNLTGPGRKDVSPLSPLGFFQYQLPYTVSLFTYEYQRIIFY